MQAFYKLTLDPIAETIGDPNSYGFRHGRSPADAIAQCFLCFRQKTSPSVVYEGDIRGCFDNIRHEWLLENIPMDKRILQQWLKAGYIDKNTLYPTEAGTPQGGIISPALANLTMDGLEAAIAKFPHRGSKRQAKLHLIRFADDFIITGNTCDLLEEDIAPGVEEFLDVRGLEVSPRLPRSEHPQIQRQTPDYPVQIKRQSCPGKSAFHHRKQPHHSRPNPDLATQPAPAGLGQLPPSRRQQGNLPKDRSLHLSEALALGKTTTPRQRFALDQKPLFREVLALPRQVQRRKRKEQGQLSCPSHRHSHPTAH
jgi:hypothetical protein